MSCSRRNRELPKDQQCMYLGQTLHEDCYLEEIHPVKACDPPAVDAATRAPESLRLDGADGLRALQEAIYEFVKRQGKITTEYVTIFEHKQGVG